MPRSVIVLSRDPGLFQSVRAALQSNPRFIDGGESLHCDGQVAPLTNIYPVETVAVEWDDWKSDLSEMPDPSTMAQLVFECRSAEWVAEVCGILARELDSPIWIVDSADNAWRADRIDPAKLALG